MRDRRLLLRLDLAPARPDRVVVGARSGQLAHLRSCATRVDAAFAGRAFAAYGGVYIVSSLVWLAIVERTMPRASDMIGSAICLAGAAFILYGARWTTA